MFKRFFNESTLKKAKYILLIVVLPLLLLGWSGILRTLDLALYDLGFHLRPTEAIDERIVIVEWNEQNLQVLEETTISDDTLASLIEKIQAQQPSLIAFDIYRDIPVWSPRLNEEENSRAYNRLQELFRSSSNLIGIEKVIEPKINPPKELKDKGQVAATDLPSDRDGLIRRAYTFPQLSAEGKPAGLPYLGMRLAGEYLQKHGWQSKLLENNAIEISRKQNSITVKPISSFAGAYFDERHGLDFLINWRQGDFQRVSTAEVISNQIPPDLFFDRLVIIGNVSSDTADRHTLPLNRWRKTNEIGTYGAETFGVEIVAQIASSIISAALDGRALMNPVPTPVKTLLFLGSIGGVIFIIGQNRHVRNNLYLVALPSAVFITVIILVSCFIAHSRGWWLPVAWSVAGMWIAYLASAYYLTRKREREKAWALEKFNTNLLHNLKNIPVSISRSQNTIQDYANEVEFALIDIELDSEEEVDIINKLEAIGKLAAEIETQTTRIRKYRETSEQFLRYCFLNIRESEPFLPVNQTVKQIVRNFIAENENQASQRVYLLERYDSEIEHLSPSSASPSSDSGINISSVALPIILENLLANAFFAVTAKAKNTRRYLPTVSIQTKLKPRKIEFIVEDNGVGIPPAFHQKIFLPFKSYRNDRTGQGLGLYLVKEIVNSHGGTIKVESIEGQGSKFISTLPIVNRNHTRLFNNFLSFLRKK